LGYFYRYPTGHKNLQEQAATNFISFRLLRQSAISNHKQQQFVLSRTETLRSTDNCTDELNDTAQTSAERDYTVSQKTRHQTLVHNFTKY